jgi:hypothetical protein
MRRPAVTGLPIRACTAAFGGALRGGLWMAARSCRSVRAAPRRAFLACSLGRGSAGTTGRVRRRCGRARRRCCIAADGRMGGWCPRGRRLGRGSEGSERQASCRQRVSECGHAVSPLKRVAIWRLPRTSAVRGRPRSLSAGTYARVPQHSIQTHAVPRPLQRRAQPGMRPVARRGTSLVCLKVTGALPPEAGAFGRLQRAVRSPLALCAQADAGMRREDAPAQRR